ncbi:hypothetical protein G3I59_23330 [Amycolatopsis rubida]|uniref:Uncharacterized protein n=1 Tax=Amycolatopsis rubida TaxID=112413 RepID=A0ABX0BYW3_9PSEU|nr:MULTISPECIES: hypothetical protein [Amycolatopsis]MYW93470.1 hypothetical protein [Amycolatopsis rubida]NEC58457.1 hypothetical protein [Amycolatopsis rubida]OAP23916.1 hypothetical protein A4R44_05423 [Amycolatopsis sp. M39]
MEADPVVAVPGGQRRQFPFPSGQLPHDDVSGVKAAAQLSDPGIGPVGARVRGAEQQGQGKLAVVDRGPEQRRAGDRVDQVRGLGRRRYRQDVAERTASVEEHELACPDVQDKIEAFGLRGGEPVEGEALGDAVREAVLGKEFGEFGVGHLAGAIGEAGHVSRLWSLVCADDRDLAGAFGQGALPLGYRDGPAGSAGDPPEADGSAGGVGPGFGRFQGEVGEVVGAAAGAQDAFHRDVFPGRDGSHRSPRGCVGSARPRSGVSVVASTGSASNTTGAT